MRLFGDLIRLLSSHAGRSRRVRQGRTCAKRPHPEERAAKEGANPAGHPENDTDAKEVVRSIYEITDGELAGEFVDHLAADLQDQSCPPEVNSLGRTIARWRDQIVAWHRARVSNGPTEAVNNLVKRIKRVAFGITNFRNYRIRALLYAGRPSWDLLATATPR